MNSAIFQRDLPLLQGSILVLAMFFVVLNLVVDIVQTLLDPRIAREPAKHASPIAPCLVDHGEADEIVGDRAHLILA